MYPTLKCVVTQTGPEWEVRCSDFQRTHRQLWQALVWYEQCLHSAGFRNQHEVTQFAE